MKVWLASLAFGLGLPALAAPISEVQVIIQTSPLAGFQHHAGEAVFKQMQRGDRLELRREPHNPYDPRAVGVWWRGVQIGYAPRVDNVDLARLLDLGLPLEGRIRHLQLDRNPWQRVLFEVVQVDNAEVNAAAERSVSPVQ